MRVVTFLISFLLVVSMLAQNSKPIVSFEVTDANICVNECISALDHSTGNIIQWNWVFRGGNPASSDSKNPGKICYKNAGTYSIILTVKDASGNVAIDSTTISVGTVTPALISVEPNQGQAPLNVQISTSAPANQCTWYVEGVPYSGMSALSHKYLESGTFEICLVTVNQSGCSDSACVDIVVWNQLLQDTSFLIVPNVFTPNNDLQNDIFRTTSSNIVEWDSRIYNRWGQLVFNSKAPDLMWDGLWNGKPCEDGIYVYLIKAVGSDGKLYDISGTLTLFR